MKKIKRIVKKVVRSIRSNEVVPRDLFIDKSEQERIQRSLDAKLIVEISSGLCR